MSRKCKEVMRKCEEGTFCCQFQMWVPRGREVNKKKGGGSVEKMFIGDRERGTFSKLYLSSGKSGRHKFF